jgi:hypothetical protein
MDEIKNALASLAEYELIRIMPRLQLAERKGHKEFSAKVYKMLVVRRHGLGGFFTDLIRGPLMSPGREDSVANILIARLREQGYSPYKVINRKSGIVKVLIPLPVTNTSRIPANAVHS